MSGAKNMFFLIKKIFILLAFTLVPWASAQPNSANYFDAINSGWPVSFKKIEPILSANKNYILLSLIAPSKALDFRSGEDYRKAFFQNTDASKNTIGHTVVAWQCHRLDGTVIKGATGLTGETKNQYTTMLKQGWGASTFLVTLNDGHLQLPDELDAVFKKIETNGQTVSSVAIEIEQKNCLGLVQFLRKFVNHPNAPMNHFGLVPDPQKFEGGGCGSFGLAMIQATNVFPKDLTETFFRTLQIPIRLMGKNLQLPEGDSAFFTFPNFINSYKEPYNISLIRFMNSYWNLNGQEPHYLLRLVDPEMLILSLGELHKISGYPIANRFVTYFESQQKSIKIDLNFDSYAAQVVKQTQLFAQHLFKQNYKIYRSEIRNWPILILQRL
jgi:hypothetical protein